MDGEFKLHTVKALHIHSGPAVTLLRFAQCEQLQDG